MSKKRRIKVDPCTDESIFDIRSRRDVNPYGWNDSRPVTLHTSSRRTSSTQKNSCFDERDQTEPDKTLCLSMKKALPWMRTKPEK